MSVLSLTAEIAGGVVFFGSVAYLWFTLIRSAARHERAVLKEHARANRAHYAAIEAGEDDPIFSPGAIEDSVKEVVALATVEWRLAVGGALSDRLDAALIRAWAQRWQRLGDGLEVVGNPSIDLIGVVNRHDEEEDRVVARVRLRIHCKHPKVGMLGPHHGHVDERWTFGRSDNRWVLLSVSGDPLAEPVLTAPLVPTPSADTERLRDESLAKLALAQKVGADVSLNDLVRADDPPASALLDLSLLDNRFGPELIAAQLAHLLEAWEGAVNGSEGPLEDLTSNQAREILLRPARGVRLIVRDAVLKSWKATGLNLAESPPTIEATLVVEAVRYVVRDDGTAVAGNQRDPHEVKLTWVLELTDSALDPWRLAMSNNPAGAIPGWP